MALGVLPSATPTCSDACSLRVAAGPLEQPRPRAGDAWVQGGTGRQEGSQQAQLLGSKDQVSPGSTWRCWGLGRLLLQLLQHGHSLSPSLRHQEP